jgi:AcrR family transcriptional regulator
MATKRPRNAIQTRADILSAARRRFATEGFERTTLRAIATDVGVDAALVIRYFGSKQDLFATATEFMIELPDLSGVDPDEIAWLRGTYRVGRGDAIEAVGRESLSGLVSKQTVSSTAQCITGQVSRRLIPRRLDRR